MLEWIRQTKGSWGKILIGVISLSFIVFFGSSSLRNGPLFSSSHSAVAKVNDQVIPNGTFNTIFDQQTKRFGNIKGLPEALLKTFKGQVLQGLIRESLLSQKAQALGLTVSETELFDQIIANPSFKVKGKFDSLLYNQNFLPYYLNTYGREYETALKEGLESDLIVDLISDHTSLSSLELKNRLFLEQQLIKIDQIAIKETKKTPNKNESQTSAFEGKKIAEEILLAFDDSSKKDALLKKYDLKSSEGKLESTQQYLTKYREPAYDIISCAWKAYPKPCEKPIEVNKVWTIFTLSKKTSDTKKLELDPKVKEQLIRGKKNLTNSALLEHFKKNAKIKIYSLK